VLEKYTLKTNGYGFGKTISIDLKAVIYSVFKVMLNLEKKKTLSETRKNMIMFRC